MYEAKAIDLGKKEREQPFRTKLIEAMKLSHSDRTFLRTKLIKTLKLSHAEKSFVGTKRTEAEVEPSRNSLS